MCLQTYPGPMTSHRSKIETLALIELEEYCCPKVIFTLSSLLIGRVKESLSSGFPTRSYTYQAEQPQKMVRCLKFWIYETEGLYYLCSKNKGAAVQLHCYSAGDLRHCFCLFFKSRFSRKAAFSFYIGLLESLSINESN